MKVSGILLLDRLVATKNAYLNLSGISSLVCMDREEKRSMAGRLHSSATTYLGFSAAGLIIIDILRDGDGLT
jgi:hypothetical protein